MSEKADCSFVFDSSLTKYSHANLKALQDSTYLELAFHGLRAAINRLLDTKTVIDISFTERVKELLQKRSGNNLKYPYAYIVISDIDTDKTQGNLTAIAHSGIYSAGQRTKNNPVTVAYAFPGKVQFTLHILDDDARRIFLISQSLILADIARAFNFKLRAFGTEYIVTVKRTGSISTPEPLLDTSNDADASAGHLTVTYEMFCNLGFTMLAKAIESLSLSTKVYVKDDDGTEIEIATNVLRIAEDFKNE